jgi:predicted metal-dependent enzyme (double-stranded beta helix superfamily)
MPSPVHVDPEELLGFPLPGPGLSGVITADALANLRLELKELRLRLRWNILQPHIEFSRNGYVRKPLFRDDNWDLVVIFWLPGQITRVHDHNKSTGEVAVLCGEMVEEVFSWQGAGTSPRKVTDRAVTAGGLMMETDSMIHRVSAQRGPGITLHFYSPPLRAFYWYDLATGERHWYEVDPLPERQSPASEPPPSEVRMSAP